MCIKTKDISLEGEAINSKKISVTRYDISAKFIGVQVIFRNVSSGDKSLESGKIILPKKIINRIYLTSWSTIGVGLD